MLSKLAKPATLRAFLTVTLKTRNVLPTQLFVRHGVNRMVRSVAIVSSLFFGFGMVAPAFARDEPTKVAITDWPPTTMAGAILTSIVFGAVGIAMAVIGFKLFDLLTPGNLQKEVFENKNVAAAILGAAVI